MRQHHLQYTGGLAETQGLLLPSYIVTLNTLHIFLKQTQISSFQNYFQRAYCSSQNDCSYQNIAQGGLPPQPAAPGAVPAAGLVAGGAPVVHPVPLAGNIAAQVGLPPPVVAPANDWGQNRAFVAAPNHLVATVPGQVGDLGAINLQIVRILRDIMANDPQRVAEFDNLAEYIRPIVAASDATRTRERSRNLNREVWESPSVYGGEDVKP